MGQLLIRQPLLQIARTCATVDDHIVIASRYTLDCHPQKLMGLLCIKFRRIKCTEVLFLQCVIELVHQILELNIGLAFVRIDVVCKRRRIANLTSRIVLACLITQKILFTSLWTCPIESCSPSDNAILVNMNLRKFIFFENRN